MKSLVIGIVVLLCGCHAALPDGGALRDRPDDFVLSATVYTAEPAGPGTPRARRAARYIVEADGTLRSATGRGSGRDTFPPATRVLTGAQSDRLWTLLRTSGLLERGSRYLRAAPADGSDAPAAAAIDVAYHGGRAHLLVPLDGADAEAVEAERLVDELASLSWIE